MKLRNKKTGEIVERSSIVTLKYKISSCSSSLVEAEEYSSIRQLNEDWEDYEPAEPLIKDEKIRKAVRAWAEANGDTKVYYNRPTTEICINDKVGYVIRSIKFKAEFRAAIDIKSGYYTITELCGEEEE